MLAPTRRRIDLASAALLAALVAMAPAFAGCVHIRTHEQAPTLGNPAALADLVEARLPACELAVPRSVKVIVSYRPPPEEPMTTGSAIGMMFCPGWPYARFQAPLLDLEKLGPVLERLLERRFVGDDAHGPDYLLEVAFTPLTYRRLTETVYGLSLLAGPLDILGVPTHYATIRLDADLRLHDVRTDDAAREPVFERHATGIETADGGRFIYMFDYNSLDASKIRLGPPEVTFDDLFAEALTEWFSGAQRALVQAFPRRCAACKLDFEAGVERCERCGRGLPPLARAPSGTPGDDAPLTGARQGRTRGAAPRASVERMSPPR